MSAFAAPIPKAAIAADILLRWPEGEPLAALVSGGADRAHNGWSIFARPRETIVIPANAKPEDARAILDAAFARTPRVGVGIETSDRRCPFDGGWIVALGYGLGAAFDDAIEPRTDAREPLAVLHWCEDAWIVDHATGEVAALGVPPALTARREPDDSAWRISGLACSEGDAQYAANVARTVEYIRAGDAFQANIARRFTARLDGSPRAFAQRRDRLEWRVVRRGDRSPRRAACSSR